LADVSALTFGALDVSALAFGALDVITIAVGIIILNIGAIDGGPIDSVNPLADAKMSLSRAMEEA
jgi:hypothetical protein